MRTLSVLAAATLALALPLASLSPAGATPPPPASITTFVPKEKTGDVAVISRADVRHAVARPRSIDVSRWTYSINPTTHRFLLRLQATDFVRPAQRNGFTTVQYADVFVGYGEGRKARSAFGMGVDSRHPHRNSLGAVGGVVSDSCARSVRRAPTKLSFRADTVRISVSLDCIPVGQLITVTGNTSMYVNPRRPPNTEVANDYLEGISFTRTAA